MKNNLEQMTPKQIAARGRELIKLAKKKQTELQQRELLQIGEIIKNEIISGWSTPWLELATKLEKILGVKVNRPNWTAQHQNTTPVEEDIYA